MPQVSVEILEERLEKRRLRVCVGTAMELQRRVPDVKQQRSSKERGQGWLQFK